MAVTAKDTRLEYQIKVNKEGLIEVRSETGKLRFAFNDLDKAVNAVSRDIQRQTGERGRSTQVIESEYVALKKLRSVYVGTGRTMDNISARMKALEKEYKQLTQTQIQSSNALMGNVSNAGLAGATLTELNRTISDSNYGFRAVANNLSQLATLFITLQSKVTTAAYGLGAFGGTIKMLLAQLNGPLGVILAFQIIITRIEAYSMKTKKASEATAEFSKSLLYQSNILNALEVIYNDNNTTLDERLDIIKALSDADKDLQKIMSDTSMSEEERAEAGAKYIGIQKEIASLEDERKKELSKLKDVNTENFLTQEELNKRVEAATLLTKSAAIEYRKQGRDMLDNLQIQIDFRESTDKVVQITDKLTQKQKELNDAFGDSKEATKGTVAYYQAIIKKEEDLLKNTLVTSLARMAAQSRIAEAEEQIEYITGEKRKENRKDVADTISKLEERSVTERFETEEEKLAHTRDKEIERLRLIDATDKDIAIVKNLYNSLIAQATEERIQKELDAEVKKANKLAALERKVLDEKNKDNTDYLRQRILEIEILLRMAQMDAETRANLELQLHNYKMKLKGIEAKADADAEKTRKENLKKELDLIQERVDGLKEIFSAANTLMSELSNISKNRYEREINLIGNQRDLIRSNDQLTKEEKEKQLTELQKKENKYREAQIKAERDFFIVKQTMAVAEMVMNGQAAVQRMTINGVEAVTSAKTGIGKFMAALGPFGVPAFALTIGGVIASIISATSKAKQEIAGLTNAPVSLGGMSSSAPQIQAPDFNVVGASGVNQLASAISGRENRPIRAYVVSDDVSSAQEMDRKIVEGASI